MRRFLKISKWLAILGFSGAVVGALAILVAYWVIEPTLPDVEVLNDVQLQVPLRVFSADGKLIQVFGEKRRTPLDLEDIPDQLKHAFIAGEDARFYEHPGIDYQGIARAIWHIIKTGGEKGPGGSTITQQLARQFEFVSRKKTYTRKFKEWFLALKIEKELSKDQILELYLNKIYLGNRAYGVGAAAQEYYGKTVDQLTLAESAAIASSAQLPSRINPISSPELTMRRRNYVLRRMMESDYITPDQFQQAVAAEDFAYPHEPTVELEARYAAEMVRSQVVDMLGEDAYTGGYQVFTTFDSRLQQTANRAVRSGLIQYDQRHGYRGAESSFELDPEPEPARWGEILERFAPVGGMVPALVISVEEGFALAYLNDGQTISIEFDDMAWARRYETVNRRGPRPTNATEVVQVGDVIRVARGDEGRWQLTQIPEAEGALVSLNPTDGALLAVVGGFDFARSKFNRAVQARRQPGSSFKPFIYSAALDGGYTTASIVNDAPVVFEDDQLERTWKPENYSERFFGLTRLREGMVNSRNLVSIRVLRDIGVSYAWEYVNRFGFDQGEIPRDLSMALGSGSVFPLTMARAYGSLANGGFLVDPYFIKTIIDGQGRVVYEADPVLACEDCEPVTGSGLAANLDTQTLVEMTPNLAPRVMSTGTNYLIHSLLRDVVRRGTGKSALTLGRRDLAGKTGTTNDQRDAWFSGFNHAVVTTAWVGFDRFDPLGRGEVGGKAALPIWIDYMRAALEGVEEKPFILPEGVVIARINPRTGLICGKSTAGCIEEYFHSGNLPDSEVDSDSQGDSEEDPYGIF
ncbi:MAG: penicillin-binding protein 1A [Xanthomonadales bacterium]|nr:penicillin-binding protein 1A [Xanthomonadales bacterium]